MLDRIALSFANLPQNHYAEAILALPPTEETPGEIDTDYNELKVVMNKILETMRPGGRIRIGQPSSDQITKEAILTGFLIENENQQVYSS